MQIETSNNLHVLQRETAKSKTTVQNEPAYAMNAKIPLWKIYCQYTASVHSLQLNYHCSHIVVLNYCAFYSRYASLVSLVG